MYFRKLHFLMLCNLFLIFISAPLSARDENQSDWIKTKDQWGQVMFCQLIYKMPEVQTRLYSFDIEQCDKAGEVMMGLVAGYSKQDQLQLKALAEQHSYLLTQNTSDPYHSVSACRDYCSKVAENQGPGHD